MAIYRVVDLAADARAAGLEVAVDLDGTTRIVAQRHRRTGKVLAGAVCYPTGWCFDGTVDLAVARAMRPKDVYTMLVLPARARARRKAGA